MNISSTVGLLLALILVVLCIASSSHVEAKKHHRPITPTTIHDINHIGDDHSLITPPSKPSSVTAARDLIARYYPDRVSEFDLSLITPSNQTAPAYFILSSSSSSVSASSSAPGAMTMIHISGTSGVMLTAGFNYYLTHYVNVTLVTWSANAHLYGAPSLPTPLPSIPTTSITITSSFLYRYYYNICTLSYSSVWWSWSEWEREIDWMALRGINLPLALTGEEIVWYDLYMELGLNTSDIDAFLSAPAFLAWQRMGNIQGSWASPISLTWMQAQAQLQVQILARMRSLDMMAVLPGFNGYVPMALKYHYPNAIINSSNAWADFPRQYQQDDLLDPSDPLFKQIGSRFITLLTQRYGTDHFYNSDTFNEMSPKTNDVNYLQSVSAGIYRAMTAADTDAVWVLQGWFFVSDPNFWQPPQVEAWFKPVPNDKLLVLDLMSDVDPEYPRLNNYYGKMFVWNMLHNFGGNNGMYGLFSTIASVPIQARQSIGSQLVGIGTTPEGINQNEIMYDLLYDMQWTTAPLSDHAAWTRQWVTSRYSMGRVESASISAVYDAFNILIATVYNCTVPGQWGVTKSFVELTPGLQMNSTGFMPTEIWYPNSALEQAARLLLSVNGTLLHDDRVDRIGRARYLYDVVDVTKQYLSNVLISYHGSFVDAYNNKNLAALTKYSDAMIALISDMDSLCATHESYLLGRWISDARVWGGDDVDAANVLEWNARNQVTLWGPNGEIADYASKQWSGLISNYYQPRWQMFVDTVIAAVKAGQAWDASAYGDAKRVVEQAWQWKREKFPTEPEGDTIVWATYIVNKYSTPVSQ